MFSQQQDPRFPEAKADRLARLLDWVEHTLEESEQQANPVILQRLDEHNRSLVVINGSIENLAEQVSEKVVHPDLTPDLSGLIQKLELENEWLRRERDELQTIVRRIYQALGLTGNP